MIWRTAVKSVVAAGCFGFGMLFFVGIGLAILIGVFAAVGSSGDGEEFEHVYGVEGSSNKLLSIKVRGVILGEEPDGTSVFGSPGVVYGYEIKDKLLAAAEDSSIDGVIVEFETPGGTIFGSQAISDGIKEYQARTGNPVVAFVAGLSASGGMYAMAPADRVLADHGSLIGSIGVTMGAFQFWDGVIATEGGIFGGGVTTENGIKFQPITSGRSKDMGAPYRALTTEEVRVLQQTTDNIYADFVQHISETRGIPADTIRNQIGALVFDNKTAIDYKLIDATATRDAAYAEAAQLAGFSGANWQVVRDTDQGSVFDGILGRGETEQPQAATAGICFPAYTVLAIHGDVQALCGK